MSDDDKGYQEPEKLRNSLPCLVNESYQAQAHGYLDNTNANHVNRYRQGAPFQHRDCLLRGQASNMFTHSCCNHFGKKATAHEPDELVNSQVPAYEFIWLDKQLTRLAKAV